MLEQFLIPPQLSAVTVEMLLLRLAAALVCGQLIAWCYMLTHRGPSYSRNMTQTLVLMCLIVAMVIMLIGSNLVVAFGFMGALAVVRFRTPVRDVRDTAFIFLAVAAGLAIGTGLIVAGGIGSAAVCLVATYMWLTSFGSVRAFDGTLRVTVRAAEETEARLAVVLQRYCSRRRVLAVTPDRADEQSLDYAYEVRLRDAEAGGAFVRELRELAGVGDAHLVLRADDDDV